MILWVSIVILTIYSVLDVLRSPKALVRNLPKALWFAVVILVPVVGPIAWLLAGRPPRSSYGGSSGGGLGLRPPGFGPRRGPSAPDDDPSFLRQLDEEAFKAKMRERRAKGTPEPPRPSE